MNNLQPITNPAEITQSVLERIEQENKEFASTVEVGFSSQEILGALDRNEDGDAQLYIEVHRGRFCFDAVAGRWYVFKGHSWKPDFLNEAMAAINDIIDIYSVEIERQIWQRIQAVEKGQEEDAANIKAIQEKLFSRIKKLRELKRKKDVLTLSRTGDDSLAIKGDEWDQDPWLLACQNGIIDLRTGILRDGMPDDFIKTVTPVEYHGIETPAPLWERFVLDIFDNDAELASFNQRLLGYSITGETSEHIAPIFQGQGRNGKSTEIEILSYVLGSYAGQIESEMLLAQKFGKQSGAASPDILSLMGKRFVYCSETEKERRFNVSRLKWLSGGDSLTGRPLYGKEFITFRPSHKIFLSTNYKPHASADDYAFWKRVLLIEFPLSFVDEPIKPHERKVDKQLQEKLKAEASGILSWLVRGCLEWQRQGLNPPVCVKIATQEYQKDEDDIEQFLSDCCLIGESYQVQAGKLHEAYVRWAKNNGLGFLCRKDFGIEMQKRFDSYEKRYVFYIGIGLKEE